MKRLLSILLPLAVLCGPIFSQNTRVRHWEDITIRAGEVEVVGLIKGQLDLEFKSVEQMLGYDYSKTSPGARVKCNGYHEENDGFFGPDVFWDPDSTATADGLSVFDPTVSGDGRLIRSFDEIIEAAWAGASGNGVTDDTTAIQTILDLNRVARLGRGQYRVTSQLKLHRSSGIIGVNWSQYPTTAQTGTGNEQVQATWNGQQESILFYDGSTGSTTCVLYAGTETIGTEPSSGFNTTTWGVVLQDFIVDGNDKAAYGIYATRPSDWKVDNVAVTGTDLHAFYFNGVYSGRYSKLSAVFNKGAGISFGRAKDDFSWTTNYQINGVYFEDLYATANGQDKDFDQTSNPDGGYGIGLCLHRGNVVDGFVAETNDGVGLYYSPTSGPNYVRNGYLELNNYYDVSATDAVDDGRAEQGWGIWFVGQTGGGNASVHQTIENVFIQGGSSAQGIRLTGTEPSGTRPEGGLELKQIYPSKTFVDATPGPVFYPLFADWDNYRLIDCAAELVSGAFTPFAIDARIASSDQTLNRELAEDGAITATDQTLTSATNPFSASMVGQTITVTGAGVSGEPLVTTIASYTGVGEVELTDAASTTVTGERIIRTVKGSNFERWMVGKYIVISGAGASGVDLVTDIASLTDSNEVELTDAASTTVVAEDAYLQSYFTSGWQTYTGVAFEPNGSGLDAYKEGSWTPVIAGSSTPGTNTYSLQLGRYTVTGNILYFYGKIVMTALDGALAGNILITGLPEKNSIDGNKDAGGQVTKFTNLGSNTGVITCLVPYDSDEISLFKHDGVASSTPVVAADITATTTLTFSGFYEID